MPRGRVADRDRADLLARGDVDDVDLVAFFGADQTSLLSGENSACSGFLPCTLTTNAILLVAVSTKSTRWSPRSRPRSICRRARCRRLRAIRRASIAAPACARSRSMMTSRVLRLVADVGVRPSLLTAVPRGFLPAGIVGDHLVGGGVDHAERAASLRSERRRMGAREGERPAATGQRAGQDAKVHGGLGKVAGQRRSGGAPARGDMRANTPSRSTQRVLERASTWPTISAQKTKAVATCRPLKKA